MMNTIALRISDFLKQYPPFNMLQQDQLLAISGAVEVIYVEPENFVFKTTEPVKSVFYVVREGAIGLYREDTQNLVDECDEGDIFGLRALIRQGNYKLTAKALEESIVYSISSDLLEEYITSNMEANMFLMKSFASNTSFRQDDTWQNPISATFISDFNDAESITYSKNPITCHSNTPIQEAAQTMTTNRVGSIIITDNQKPIGIITDKDLRVKIATGNIRIEAPVTEIMSTPVITYPETISVAEAQIAMLEHKITHLCITKDGTPNSALTGILSEHDILVIRENNASILVKEIKRCQSSVELQQIRMRSEALLKRYLEQDLPINHISKIISAINDNITKQVISLALKDMPTKPPVDFAWMSMGSQGRHEQLLLTDQDNFLVFEDVEDANYETTQHYFLEFAKKITEGLNTVGFEYCPANMMGSNPKWCLSLSEWRSQFKRWITHPDQDHLMLCTIFFDFAFVYGDKSLADKLSENIFDAIDSHDIFLNYLGLNALNNPPPLSFFRNFLVESSGEHKDQFDIKARAMMPLVDAARLLILSKHIASINNTTTRYQKLMDLEPQNKDIYEACLLSYEDLLHFRTKQGLKHSDSGRFIDLQQLSKADRLELKSSFKAIKSVQELIQTRYKLSQLM
ncbi:nucleotidyltransferase [Hanstruepera neustonica]|uniref:Nucleotidyltransferase n=2 Tax=Hanstruepera neustonica TaxID=1445657 RepID=A0A2K1DX27_9FLAO|nr:nucleotidyltransferase [Hanstruepera neustonica]